VIQIRVSLVEKMNECKFHKIEILADVAERKEGKGSNCLSPGGSNKNDNAYMGT